MSPGSNRALFTATDNAGNEATAQVVVDYKRPVAAEAPADVFFVVTAKSVATGRAKSFEFAYKP